jgi:glycosyltransferase involved in cell wall biosynthesis
MGAVIRTLVEHRIGGESVSLSPTWVAHSRRTTALLSARAAIRMTRMPRRAVAHVHVSERGSFVREGALVALARRLGLASVITIHGANFLQFAKEHSWLACSVLERAGLITCMDEEVLAATRSLAPRVRSEFLANPVVMDRYSPRASGTEQMVLFAGEIGHRKGADVLLGAWGQIARAHPKARLVMVGPMSDVRVPRLERLEVREAVAPATVRALIREARVIVLPSRAEGMPMILTEAMGAGRPFVSTPVGGIPDLARAGGVLVEVGDEAGLAERVGAFLASPALACRIGELGRRHATATRSVGVIDARLRELYDAVAG